MHPPKLVLLLSAVLAWASAGRVAHAQTFNSLVNFDGTNGGLPLSGLTLSGSTLYGVTNIGGQNDDGTFFSLPVGTSALTTLGSFNGTDGAYPRGNLATDGSNFYGITRGGGTNGDGAVFSVPLAGGNPVALTSFNGTDGALPEGSLTLSGSTLYGMAYDGGQYNLGTVYSIPVTGGTPTTLASFNDTDGGLPSGDVGLTLVGSTLYGMTGIGGTYNQGVIFSLPVTGGTPTVLYSFDNSEQASGALTLVGSTLYGMTSGGGAYGDGEIFSIPLTGGIPTILYSFSGPDGNNPQGSLTLSANGTTLYGTTSEGGQLAGSYLNRGDGIVFSFPVGGGQLTTLHQFTGADGDTPQGDITQVGSTLYGMAFQQGAYNLGTVFDISLATPEPPSIVLLGLGAIAFGLAALRRRQRCTAARH